MVGHFEVGQRNDRLNVVFEHFIKEVIIELQAFFIGLQFISVGENSRPGNARAEALKAHFRQHGQIFFIMMIKINGFVIGVVFARQYAIRDFAWNAVAACGHDVSNADPFAAFLPAAF